MHIPRPALALYEEKRWGGGKCANIPVTYLTLRISAKQWLIHTISHIWFCCLDTAVHTISRPEWYCAGYASCGYVSQGFWCAFGALCAPVLATIIILKMLPQSCAVWSGPWILKLQLSNLPDMESVFFANFSHFTLLVGVVAGIRLIFWVAEKKAPELFFRLRYLAQQSDIGKCSIHR